MYVPKESSQNHRVSQGPLGPSSRTGPGLPGCLVRTNVTGSARISVFKSKRVAVSRAARLYVCMCSLCVLVESWWPAPGLACPSRLFLFYLYKHHFLLKVFLGPNRCQEAQYFKSCRSALLVNYARQKCIPTTAVVTGYTGFIVSRCSSISCRLSYCFSGREGDRPGGTPRSGQPVAGRATACCPLYNAQYLFAFHFAVHSCCVPSPPGGRLGNLWCVILPPRVATGGVLFHCHPACTSDRRVDLTIEAMGATVPLCF